MTSLNVARTVAKTKNRLIIALFFRLDFAPERDPPLLSQNYFGVDETKVEGTRKSGETWKPPGGIYSMSCQQEHVYSQEDCGGPIQKHSVFPARS